MISWRIFVHSVRQVFGNFGASLRISGPVILAGIVGTLVLGVGVTDETLAGNQVFMHQIMGRALLWFAIIGFAGLWVAVAWHRFVLLEEHSGTLLPTLYGGQMLSYFGRGLLIGLLLMAIGFAIGLVVGLVISPFMSSSPLIAGLILVIMVRVPLSWVFYRYCLVLPAAALGEPMRLAESWAKTATISGGLFRLVLIITAVSVIGEILGNLMSEAGLIVSLGFTLAYQWSVLMISISILTTLYGHLVEGRELI